MAINFTGFYSQDFDTLAPSSTSTLLPQDWVLLESGTNANAIYTAGTGSSNTGDTYSFGASGNSERALGGLQSGSLVPSFGTSFTNNTDSPITSLTITFTGEQWRLGATGRSDRLDFQYSLDATSLASGSWVDVDALDFSSVISSGTVGALDGNANSTLVTATITGLNIPVGATFWFRWQDFNASGADDGLAIDNFSITTGVTPSTPVVTIAAVDGAAAEAGTNPGTFRISRTGDTTNALTVSYSAGGTADTEDYSPNLTGTATIAAGQSFVDVTITPMDDAEIEGNETVTLTLVDTADYDLGATVTASVAIADNDGTPGTIRIRDIQGTAHISPLVGQTVNNVAGIVTAVATNGFYFQDPNFDADDRTSEGIFVFTSSAPTVAVGDSILVNGTVAEFRPGNNANNLTITQITGPSITVLSSGNALPTAVVLGNGGRTIPTQSINNDFASSGNVETGGDFDPANEGIDFYESVEGMRVQLNNTVATSPTASFSSSEEIWVLADNGENATSRTVRGSSLITSSDFNPERIQIDDLINGTVTLPAVNVGAQLGQITGVVSYDFNNYEVLVSTAPTVLQPSPLQKEVTNLTGNANQLTVATFNVENLDPSDGAAQFAALAAAIVNNLRSPDIISLEEIQDNNGAINDGIVDANETLQTLIDAIAAAGGPTYEFRQLNPVDDQDGGEPGGNIRVGFLFNPNRVGFVEGSLKRLTDPNPAEADSFAGDDFASSRKPLVGTFTFNGQQVTVIGNHFNSKGGDQPLFGPNQPPTLTSENQRNQQATIVRDYVQTLLTTNPTANVIVAGDLNDFEFSSPVSILENGGLNTLVETLPANERYTYNFQGNAQVLDHVLVSDNLLTNLDGFDVVHINSEFADQVSDHDPVVARFNLPASNPAPTVDLSTYVRIGRYNLPEPTRTAAPANNLLAQEVSAVTYNWDADTLFVVGDGGRAIVQISKTGQLIDTMTLASGNSPQGTEFYDTEGLTYVGNGQFVLIEERDRQANLFTYNPGATLTRADVQTVKLGTTVGNIGIEGISYDPLTNGFIAVKENQPQGIFQTGIDFAAGTATNGSPTTDNSTNLFDPALANLIDFADVFALSNLPSLNGQADDDNLLVLSQESGRIVNIDRNGNISSSLTITSDPGNALSVADQGFEGVTMDRNGFLYITSEEGGGDINNPQLWVYAPASYTYSNQAPNGVSLANPTTTLSESTSTTAPVKVGNIVISDDALGTNSLTLSGPDASFFEISGTELFLKAGTVLDFETKTSYSINVNVDDPTVGSGSDATVPFTLAVTDIVEAPVSLVISEVAPWASGNSLVSADWFEVTNTGTTAVNITGWRMDDSSNSFAASVTLNGITSIASGESVIFLESAAPATVIDNFKTLWFGTNAPANLQIGTYTGSGVGLGTGGDAVNLFNAGGTLQTSVTFSTSPAGPSFSSFDNAAGLNNTTIAQLSAVGVNGAFVAAGNANEIGSPGRIVNVNQAPTAVVLSNEVGAIAENTSTATRIKVADIGITDDGLGTNVLALSGADASSFEIDGNALYLRAGTALDFETRTSYTVTVNVDDATVGGTPDTSTNYTLAVNDVAETFQLQLLHYYGESGLLGVETAPIMGALIDRFDDQYTNTLVLGEGDSYIPGPWLIGGADPSLNNVPGIGSTALGRPDIAIMNAFGTDASALGNHEFDLGSPVLQGAIQASGAWVGAQFPLITANLDFSADSSLRGLADSSLGGTATNNFAGQEASTIKGKIAPYTVVTQGGERIGIVGATTFDLLTKTSPNGTVPQDDGNLSTDDLQEVAAYIQASVNALRAQGINKIIMVDQLDTLDRNKALAPLLSGIDVMVAGGGHERMGDATDTPVGFNGHTADFIPDAYPIVATGADGKTTLIVTTDTEYTYLGRLVVDFDANGEIIVPNLNPAINGAYASTEANLQAAYGTTASASQIIASSTIGSQVQAITNAINNVITTKDSTIWGYTNVYLEGDRAFGRTQEVNLGDVTADANIYAAQQSLGSGAFIVSLKNGGGLRASIGSIDEDGSKIAPAANPLVGKPAGAISTLDIENALRFDNKLMVFDTTPQGLKNIMEYAAGLSSGPSQQNGGYMQIGGIRVSYDPDNAPGSKVQSIALTDLNGNVTQVIYANGGFYSGAPATIQMVTLNFTANGGDGYPIKANGENFRYLLGNGGLSAPVSEALDFTAAATFSSVGITLADILGEQRAFQSYLQNFHATPETAYGVADTPIAQDQRIQNLNFRGDNVILAPTDIALGNTSIAENSANNAVVSALTATDPNSSGPFTFSLLDNAGGRFAINGSNLVVADGTLLNYEANTSHSMTIRVTDASGAFYDESFAIAISNVNEAPVATNDTASTTDLQSVVIPVLVNDSDVDAGDTLVVASFTNAANGTVVRNADNTLTYTPNPGFAGSDSFTYTIRDSGNLTSTATVTLTVTQASNQIIGTNGNDNLVGTNRVDVILALAGNDTLNGGLAADRLVGGLGNDTYIVDAGDEVVEALDEGIDLVRSSISWVLADNVENLTLMGNGAIDGTGNNLANVFTGNNASNVFRGLGGDDTYNISSANDTVVENAGEGTDLIRASISLTLGNNVENLTLTGNGNINGTGNTLDNVLTGNSGRNQLTGLGGNDVLNGLGGNDAMAGGLGNDTYVVNTGGDRTLENANEGIDQVLSAINWSLATNVENLSLTGNGNINGTGNALDNQLTGNIGNNTLNGSSGSDILIGNRGVDTLIGGSGNDTFVFNALNERGDRINDFNTNQDTLNLGELFDSFEYDGSNPINDGYIRFTRSGSTTLVQVDQNGLTGGANFSTLVTLNNVAPASLVVGSNVIV